MSGGTYLKWQAHQCSGELSSNRGIVWEQISFDCGQRVRNTQPLGGLDGDGISPESVTNLRFVK